MEKTTIELTKGELGWIMSKANPKMISYLWPLGKELTSEQLKQLDNFWRPFCKKLEKAYTLFEGE